MNTKTKLMCVLAGAAVAGCATRQATVELEERDDRLLGMMRLEAKHARLKSVLGISATACRAAAWWRRTTQSFRRRLAWISAAA